MSALAVKLGATFHQAPDTEHSYIIKCDTPGCTRILGKSRKFWGGVKLIHEVCPDCIQRDLVTCNSTEKVEQLKNDLIPL